MTLEQFLTLCLTGGGIGVIVSLLAEYMPYFADFMAKLSSQGKRLVILLICLVIPLGALVARMYVQNVMVTPDMVWSGIYAGLTAFASSQVVHLLIRE